MFNQRLISLISPRNVHKFNRRLFTNNFIAGEKGQEVKLLRLRPGSFNKAKFAKAKNAKANKKKLLLPDDVQETLAEWRTFLLAERQACSEQFSTRQGTAKEHFSMALPVKRLSQEAVEGIHLEFSTAALNLSDEKLAAFSSLFKTNSCIFLRPAVLDDEEEEEEESAVENGKENAVEDGKESAVEVENDDMDIVCKAKIIENRNGILRVSIRPDDAPCGLGQLRLVPEWRISLVEQDDYERLLKLMRQAGKFVRFPGYPVFLKSFQIGGKTVKNAKEGNEKRREKKFLANDLNESQASAVLAALSRRHDFVAIHGPPGTGKTRVLAEIVEHYTRKKAKKVLVCAPSNKAVDNALIACLARGVNESKCIRLGNRSANDNNNEEGGGAAGAAPVHFLSMLKQHTFYKELEQLYQRRDEFEEQKAALECKTEREKLDYVLRMQKQMELYMRREIIRAAQVVFCTATCGDIFMFMEMGLFKPDLIIMDEASQITEPFAWRILLQAERFVIVGDHKQLNAFTHCTRDKSVEEVEEMNVPKSLLERLMEEFKEKKGHSHLLDVNYRSNEKILRWSNQMFYEDRLDSHRHVKNITLADITREQAEEEKHSWKLIDEPLVLLDTAAISNDELLLCRSKYPQLSTRDFRELKHENTTSSLNRGEALCAAHQLMALRELGGLATHEIGCITPYTAQTMEIRRILGRQLGHQFDISSVDSFQGQQREAIVMSFVRSNAENFIGFLENLNRMNVAVTRAKRQFFLIASSYSLQADKSLSELLRIIRAEGRVIGIGDLLAESPFKFDFSSNAVVEVEKMESDDRGGGGRVETAGNVRRRFR